MHKKKKSDLYETTDAQKSHEYKITGAQKKKSDEYETTDAQKSHEYKITGAQEKSCVRDDGCTKEEK